MSGKDGAFQRAAEEERAAVEDELRAADFQLAEAEGRRLVVEAISGWPFDRELRLHFVQVRRLNSLHSRGGVSSFKAIFSTARVVQMWRPSVVMPRRIAELGAAPADDLARCLLDNGCGDRSVDRIERLVADTELRPSRLPSILRERPAANRSRPRAKARNSNLPTMPFQFVCVPS